MFDRSVRKSSEQNSLPHIANDRYYELLYSDVGWKRFNVHQSGDQVEQGRQYNFGGSSMQTVVSAVIMLIAFTLTKSDFKPLGKRLLCCSDAHLTGA